jgi:hypothetical protein
MNSKPFNWFVVLATFVVWASVLWWTVRIATDTRVGLVLKSLAVCLLFAFGFAMLWNAYVGCVRSN